ncbi:hypothetical protein GCM10011571_01690 [Marinithermofilum abyssi]|uniref:HTH cro/C1-type domain-containing protein n=1 Tax=Marinithermofilum abyssi TaxID=1571185 RepID=A0A8J2VFL6_9BACL|nr:helix-turn-helix transcriptional regulator [Marinithermofilum abyssi]GGE04367.1 hypothetical protein GCM10011571_01690 [Marinithermofilum abyssi]
MFCKRLSQLRKRSNLTQEQLAKELGISRGSLSMYEIGKREPDFLTLQKVAHFFSVTSDFLIGLSDDPHGYGSLPPLYRELTEITEEEIDYLRESLEAYRKVKQKWE